MLTWICHQVKDQDIILQSDHEHLSNTNCPPNYIDFFQWYFTTNQKHQTYGGSTNTECVSKAHMFNTIPTSSL